MRAGRARGAAMGRFAGWRRTGGHEGAREGGGGAGGKLTEDTLKTFALIKMV